MALSEDMKTRIKERYEQLKSYRKVAGMFSVSHNTVKKIVLNEYKAEKRKPGPKLKISNREKRAIKNATSKMLKRGERVTSRKVQKEAGMNQVSLRTIQRRLAELYSYKKAKRQILLSPEHRLIRLQMAESWICSPPDWSKVIFSDEKRFNSDGPDSWKSWVPKDCSILRNRRQQGGPSLQVWGALLPNAMLLLFQLPQRLDSVGFMKFMDEEVLPNIKALFGDEFILQQDNAATHNSRYSLAKFQELGVDLLPWPSRSPDLNIIENCWSMIAGMVYDGRQFENTRDLWRAIDEAVTEINVGKREFLLKLFDSIPRRLVECVKLNGSLTHY